VLGALFEPAQAVVLNVLLTRRSGVRPGSFCNPTSVLKDGDET